MKALLIVTAAVGAILLFLLAGASANSALFARHYPWLLGLNAIVVLALLGLVGWQVVLLWREHRDRVFGSRLKLRLMLMFGLMAVLPGVLLYGVSVQFVTRSIESWFDVRVEKALESGLNLGRAALESLQADLVTKADAMALELSEKPEAQRLILLDRLREQTGAQSAAIISLNGIALATASADLRATRPNLPTPAQLRQIRAARGIALIEGEGASGMTIRVLAVVPPFGLADEPRVLQLMRPVPAALAQNAESVQGVYRDYQELHLAREGLTQIYALTLTLTLLLALFAAFAVAFILARRLSAPLSILAEGTQAVAQGDFTPRRAIYSRDELGVLTQSFNQMTRQLDDARALTERHRAEVESARAYLESILANLSAGVLVFDRRFVLRTANEGALDILDDDLVGLIGEAVEAWPREKEFGRAIRDGFAANAGEATEAEWQTQIQLEGPDGQPQVLLLRGSKLPDGSGGGYLVVFDDVTELIAAQRSAAWGEVARRLAHEIKNPLTPIQLSAERLQVKLADHLEGADAEMLNRATQTIINQVQAMNRMVDEFRDYARMPAPDLAAVDLNALVGEVLALYETSHAPVALDLAPGLPPVRGDAGQLRQIIHNLLKNAEDALAETAEPRIEVRTEAAGGAAILCVADNGPGFPPEIMGRIYEPYVTTKVRGTGLGLAIVRKIVDEHGGKIEVSNRKPHGAQVSIRFPLSTAEEGNHGANTGH